MSRRGRGNAKQNFDRKQFFCDICNISCLNAVGFQAHKVSTKHKENEKALRGNSMLESLPERKDTLLKYLHDPRRSEPLIGVDYVTEFPSDDGREPQYECELCSFRRDGGGMVDHLISVRHRKAVVSKKYPQMMAFNQGNAGETAEIMRQKAAVVEELEGPKMFKLAGVLPEMSPQSRRFEENFLDMPPPPKFPRTDTERARSDFRSDIRGRDSGLSDELSWRERDYRNERDSRGEMSDFLSQKEPFGVRPQPTDGRNEGRDFMQSDFHRRDTFGSFPGPADRRQEGPDSMRLGRNQQPFSQQQSMNINSQNEQYLLEEHTAKKREALEYLEHYEIASDEEAALVLSITQNLTDLLKRHCQLTGTTPASFNRPPGQGDIPPVGRTAQMENRKGPMNPEKYRGNEGWDQNPSSSANNRGFGSESMKSSMRELPNMYPPTGAGPASRKYPVEYQSNTTRGPYRDRPDDYMPSERPFDKGISGLSPEIINSLRGKDMATVLATLNRMAQNNPAIQKGNIQNLLNVLVEAGVLQ